MRVYVLEQWFDSYEFLGVVGVFSSREVADRLVEAADDDLVYHVRELELDVAELGGVE